MGSATDEEGIPDGWQGLDVGPKSRELFREVVLRAKTIVWNGPVGVFEFPAFAEGSIDLLHAVVEATKGGATTVIGIPGLNALLAQFQYLHTFYRWWRHGYLG